VFPIKTNPDQWDSDLHNSIADQEVVYESFECGQRGSRLGTSLGVGDSHSDTSDSLFGAWLHIKTAKVPNYRSIS
jgi:hypothetical protein